MRRHQRNHEPPAEPPPTDLPAPGPVATPAAALPADPAANPPAAALPADPAANPPAAALPADPAPTPAARPRRRVRHALALAIGAVALAMVAIGGLAAFDMVYAQFGFHPEKDALSWAGHTPEYSLSGDCTDCHATETDHVRTSWHEDLRCESCHGPLAAHAATATKTDKGSVPVEPPERAICVTCHEQVAGRPVSFPQVELAVHYQDAACAQCHGVHQIIAAKPPRITHPRTNLPDCVVCHAPEGIKGLPDGHKSSFDAVCVTCHKPGDRLELHAVPS